MKPLLILLIIISCNAKEKVIYKRDYCKVKDIKLNDTEKQVITLENKRKIVNNNVLYFCNCNFIVASEEFKNICK